MAVIQDKSVLLNNGKLMPLLGLGCWQSRPEEVEAAVEAALDNGYLHIDTAYNYRNEEAVGKGIKNWISKSKDHKREDLFIVTKLPMIGMSKEGVSKFLRLSLSKLQLSYVDLYLIHAPVGMKGKSDEDIFPMTSEGSLSLDYSTDLIAIWKEMEVMVDRGLARSIGLSNFSIPQIKKMIAIAKIPPAVHQVEMHVNFQQKEMVEFCNKEKIVVTAYAPLGSPGRQGTRFADIEKRSLLSNPVVQLVADNHKVTTAQILIRFLIQQGVVTIPKSVNPDRIKVNGDVFGFSLTETEMAAIRILDLGKEGRTFTSSGLKGISDHPEWQRD